MTRDLASLAKPFLKKVRMTHVFKGYCCQLPSYLNYSFEIDDAEGSAHLQSPCNTKAAQ